MQCPGLKPLDKIRAVYRAECPHRSLEWDILGFCEHGFFFSTPTYILMGKAVDLSAAHELWADPFYSFDPNRWVLNAWYIFQYAGNKEEAFRCAFEALPHKLQFIAFHKRKTIHVLDFKKFQERCSRKTPFTPTS